MALTTTSDYFTIKDSINVPGRVNIHHPYGEKTTALTKVNALPIILDRKATFYEGDGTDPEIFHSLDGDDKVILTSDGTKVEYWTSCFIDFKCPPLDAIQITLDITAKELDEWTHGEDTYVDLVLVAPNKIGVFITTLHDVIYDEVHTLA